MHRSAAPLLRAGALVLSCLLLAQLGVTSARCEDGKSSFPLPALEWAPLSYICYHTTSAIKVDGRLDEASWMRSSWTSDFVDIEGRLKPRPSLLTRVKMVWDEVNFYIAAEMQEPHLWSTLTDRDAVIFHDNDFEVFIDPNGDTHEYYELEINTLGTEWDLLLPRPYRDGATAIDSWDIQGLKTGIQIFGTLNDPTDRDRGWSIEIAIPWSVLEECAHKSAPPADGDQWRVNFSRVEWRLASVEGQYIKQTDPATGKLLPEANWVWSPQGLINMHYPERWGFVQFSDLPAGTGRDVFELDPDGFPLQVLRELYYKQRGFHSIHGRYATNLSDLDDLPPTMTGWDTVKREHFLIGTTRGYEIFRRRGDGSLLHIDELGRTWKSKRNGK
ncbi:MAG: carbohydrate-binding family 9-like protein [bacterium]|nr:carbohydrate-binding family 9-like protein [bacterium]